MGSGPANARTEPIIGQLDSHHQTECTASDLAQQHARLLAWGRLPDFIQCFEPIKGTPISRHTIDDFALRDPGDAASIEKLAQPRQNVRCKLSHDHLIVFRAELEYPPRLDRAVEHAPVRVESLRLIDLAQLGKNAVGTRRGQPGPARALCRSPGTRISPPLSRRWSRSAM